MVQIIDVILPIFTLVIAALLTIPIFRVIRKHENHKTALTLGWVLAVFLIAGATVANLALSYYSTANPSPLNLALDGSVSTAVSSSFLIDAISIYMAIIIVAISSVVLVYTVFFINSNERPSDRYLAIMFILTAALLGAVLSGDLLTFFIFWESATAGRCVFDDVPKERFQPQRNIKVSCHGHHCFGIRFIWDVHYLRFNRQSKL
jgi:multicomponent Na+:H+ antiporter subunit A